MNFARACRFGKGYKSTSQEQRDWSVQRKAAKRQTRQLVAPVTNMCMEEKNDILSFWAKKGNYSVSFGRHFLLERIPLKQVFVNLMVF